MNYLGLLDFGAPELLIIFLIVLLLFGGKKLPELARSAGTSVHELRKGLNDGAHEKPVQRKQNEEEQQQQS